MRNALHDQLDPAPELGRRRRSAVRSFPLRIHARLDDHRRYLVAIQATTTEREVEMLALMAKSMRDN